MGKRRVLASVIGLVLMLGALGGPAVAVNGGEARVYSVQGLPGIRIDVCAGGEEGISRLRYGRVASDVLPAGQVRVRVFEADPRVCRGHKLIDRTITLEADDNLTLVYGIFGGSPALRSFDNLIGLSGPERASVTLRHAARAAAVDGWVLQAVQPAAVGHGPTVSDLSVGESVGPLDLAQRSTVVLALGRRVNEGASFDAFAGRAYQAVLIGTTRDNYRIVVFSQAGVVI